MKAFLIIAIQALIISFNVSVSEAAPVQPGVYSIKVPCNSSETINTMLKDKYREQLVYKGLSPVGIMKFFANTKTNTFTVALETGGMSCLLVAGNYLMKQVEGISL
jgi:hypothetical protein